ncbi:hypothetical protein TNCV_1912281 [Trichonephila clavipes]|nr:hypothetical protein TNCV_1912281 [Trichonephila clavipes]
MPIQAVNRMTPLLEEPSKTNESENPLHGNRDGTCLQEKMPRIIMGLTATTTAGSDVVQSGRPIFDYFFQHLWPYIGNNTANVAFQMVKHLWLIRIDQ